MEHLFIYGTLAPGQPNHHVMAGIDGSWRPATVRGVLYEEGWGADQGCPGMVPSPDGNAIDGYVLSSESLVEHWGRLDAFEGDGYQRVLVPARLDSGEMVETYVYALNRSGG